MRKQIHYSFSGHRAECETYSTDVQITSDKSKVTCPDCKKTYRFKNTPIEFRIPKDFQPCIEQIKYQKGSMGYDFCETAIENFVDCWKQWRKFKGKNSCVKVDDIINTLIAGGFCGHRNSGEVDYYTESRYGPIAHYKHNDRVLLTDELWGRLVRLFFDKEISLVCISPREGINCPKENDCLLRKLVRATY